MRMQMCQTADDAFQECGIGLWWMGGWVLAEGHGRHAGMMGVGRRGGSPGALWIITAAWGLDWYGRSAYEESKTQWGRMKAAKAASSAKVLRAR